MNASEKSGRIREAAAWAGLLALAAALRTWHLSLLPPSVDDIGALYRATRPGTLADWLSLARADPLHMLGEPVLSLLAAAVSSSTVWLRAPGIVLGLGSVVLLQRLGARLGGPRTGWIAAILLACSPFHIEWCRRVNFYSPLVFFALAGTWALRRALDRGSRGAWVLYAAVAIAAVYSHPFEALVLVSHGAWLAAARRRALRPWAACMAAALLSLAPWVLLALRPAARRGSIFWDRGPFHPADWPLWIALKCWSGGTEESSYLWGPGLGKVVEAETLYFLFLFAAGCQAFLAERPRDRGWLLAAALPPLGLAAVMALDKAAPYFFAPRQTIFALPFFLLVAAKGADALLARARRPEAAAAVVAAWLAAFALVFAADARGLFGAQRERLARLDWLRSSLQPGDVLLAQEPQTAAVFLFQYDPAAFRRLPPLRFPGDAGGYFEVPDREPLRVGPAANPLFELMRPRETDDERTRRWAVLAPQVAGKRVYYLDFFSMGEPAAGLFASTERLDSSGWRVVK